ncbi:hypothetical protein APASM_5219 [Actinosynnema pretiosum subsp. pretiosum]|nr:hypothetical protein APASM_5219 [Actinosynnema pretiosum subsp. pretiosum]
MTAVRVATIGVTPIGVVPIGVTTVGVTAVGVTGLGLAVPALVRGGVVIPHLGVRVVPVLRAVVLPSVRLLRLGHPLGPPGAAGRPVRRGLALRLGRA